MLSLHWNIASHVCMAELCRVQALASKNNVQCYYTAGVADFTDSVSGTLQWAFPRVVCHVLQYSRAEAACRSSIYGVSQP